MRWDRKIWISQNKFTKRSKSPIEEKIDLTKENAPTDAFQRTEKNFPIEGKKTSTDVLNLYQYKEQQQQPVVVVPFWIEKQNGNYFKKQALIAKLPIIFLNSHSIEFSGKLTISRINIEEISNPHGWLRQAIENDWKAPEPKEDLEEKAAKIRAGNFKKGKRSKTNA